uniref:Uncharacterized protein n=1 Tax=Arion vulgaris TaxID=1028688 RepID=A0A0B6ZF87_9EUPU
MYKNGEDPKSPEVELNLKEMNHSCNKIQRIAKNREKWSALFASLNFKGVTV